MVVNLIITLAIIGLVVWLITTFIPMPASIAKLIEVVAIVLCLVKVLNFLGIASF